jgi:hypothetical protein
MRFPNNPNQVWVAIGERNSNAFTDIIVEHRTENRPSTDRKAAAHMIRLKIGKHSCSSNVLFSFLQVVATHIDASRTRHRKGIAWLKTAHPAPQSIRFWQGR